MMRQYVGFLFILGSFVTFAGAQFPVNVSRITVPKAQPPRSENAAVNSRARSIGPGGLVLDDSETDFTAETVTANHKDIGWNLRPSLKMLGDVPPRSAFRLVVKKGAKELYTHRCEVTTIKQDVNQARTCYDRKAAIAETGPLDVLVYFVDGDTDQEKLLRTYKIDVRKVTKINDLPPDYYIPRYGDLAVAYLSDSQNVLFFSTFFSPVDNVSNVFGGYPFLRCTVNGTPIAYEYSTVSFRHGPVFAAERSGKKEDRSVYRDKIRFDRIFMQLPLALNANSNKDYYDVRKHPGLWKCSIMSNSDRTIFRTFSFEVASGSIIPHPEQRSGNVNLAANKFMVDMEIPAGGSSADKRMLPMPNAGLFYGIPWSTPEGKAMAARVPKKGDPFPVLQK